MDMLIYQKNANVYDVSRSNNGAPDASKAYICNIYITKYGHLHQIFNATFHHIYYSWGYDSLLSWGYDTFLSWGYDSKPVPQNLFRTTFPRLLSKSTCCAAAVDRNPI